MSDHDYIQSASGLWLPSWVACKGPSPLSMYSHYLHGVTNVTGPTNLPPITIESIKAAMEKMPPKPDTLLGLPIQFGQSWDELWNGKPGNMLQLKVDDLEFSSTYHFKPFCDLKPTWFGFDYGYDECDSKVVKIPGGVAYVENLDEHMTALRKKRDDDFEAGLRELRTASAVWIR